MMDVSFAWSTRNPTSSSTVHALVHRWAQHHDKRQWTSERSKCLRQREAASGRKRPTGLPSCAASTRSGTGRTRRRWCCSARRAPGAAATTDTTRVSQQNVLRKRSPKKPSRLVWIGKILTSEQDRSAKHDHVPCQESEQPLRNRAIRKAECDTLYRGGTMQPTMHTAFRISNAKRSKRLTRIGHACETHSRTRRSDYS